jgi:hypothetical protein
MPIIERCIPGIVLYIVVPIYISSFSWAGRHSFGGNKRNGHESPYKVPMETIPRKKFKGRERSKQGDKGVLAETHKSDKRHGTATHCDMTSLFRSTN